jgi:hypothetical protein
VKVGRAGDHRRTGRAVGHHDQAAGVRQLRVGEHIVDGVDRGPEEVVLGGEDLGPFIEGLRREDAIELGDQLTRVL